MKTAQVEGGLMPEAACLCRVISAVFMHVQNPIIVVSDDKRMYTMPLGTRYTVELVAKLTHSRVRLRDTTAHAT